MSVPGQSQSLYFYLMIVYNQSRLKQDYNLSYYYLEDEDNSLKLKIEENELINQENFFFII